MDGGYIQMRLWGVGWIDHASGEIKSIVSGVAIAASEAAESLSLPSGFWCGPRSAPSELVAGVTQADSRCLLLC